MWGSGLDGNSKDQLGPLYSFSKGYPAEDLGGREGAGV